jgi:Zn-dependent peptidase ImmA (M78 family)
MVARGLGLQVESTTLGEDISGVLVIEGGRGTIGYNAAHPSVRQRFSIAHEIGHFVLHEGHGPLFIDKKYTVYRRDPRSSSGENLQEIEANQFAAALLMPRALLRREAAEVHFDLADEATLDALAKKFDVSLQAMSIRLMNLNLL